MHERLINLKLVGVHPRRHAHTQSDDDSLAWPVFGNLTRASYWVCR